MTMRLATAVRNKMLGSHAATTGDGLAGLLSPWFLDIYSGSQPVSADAAPTGTLLETFAIGGTAGGTWLAPANGAMSRNLAEVMQATGLATGVAGWGRLRLAGDTNTLSTTAVRIDASVGTAGADIVLATTQIELGAIDILGVLTIDFALAA